MMFSARNKIVFAGLTIYRGIHAIDRDKPNTPNSDVQYAITAGNERGKFALDSSHQAFLLLKKPLDYDAGDREFILTITASVSFLVLCLKNLNLRTCGCVKCVIEHKKIMFKQILFQIIM